MEDKLSPEEGAFLLRLARQAIQEAVLGERPCPPVLEELPARLRAPGSTFVTLTIHGELRGCIGGLEAYQPLAMDVYQHAVGAAFQDYRFPPVQSYELERLEIEVSRLTPPRRLEYSQPEELPGKLKPGIDGVIVLDGARRATFLPQVWQKLNSPEEFLDHLCVKMGAPPDLWRIKPLQVMVYQVEEFYE